MESLLVSPLLQVLFDKLASPIIRELKTSRGFRNEIRRLQDKLPVIQAVIEDAEERQHHDRKIKIWLAKLKDVAYDADDLLDEIGAPALRKELITRQTYLSVCQKIPESARPAYCDQRLPWHRKLNTLEQIKFKVQMAYLNLEVFTNYFKMSRKLKETRERLDEIAREMGDFQLKEVVVLRQTSTKERRETGPLILESEVCGRKEDVGKIVDMLLSSNSDVWIIPILGIGGIGKTTLAQLVYNNEMVAKHFDLKMWISVYDEFRPRMIMRKMLEFAAEGQGGPLPEDSQLSFLQSQLRGLFCGRRFLLVLDDVWNEDPDEWDKIRNVLHDAANGSKIIVTTRSQKVASIMSATPPYHLGPLSEDDCWTLFKQRAFPDGENSFHNLLSIGRQIVKKCKGVPLAAKVLGSLMRFKREESEWLRVQEHELWNLDEGVNRILSVLKLSFNHLPSHLKPCFAYCAVFPKNYEINREKLIQQWVANGLISSFEDMGNDYFNDFLWLSFLYGESSDDSSPTVFKMHDLIHNLAISVAGKEFLTIDQQRNLTQGLSTPVFCDGFVKARHALIDGNFGSDLIPKSLYKEKELHTLNLLSLGDVSEKKIRNIISGFKHLRVLNLSGLSIEKLHESIGDMICLRYLDLSYTAIENLPKTICRLCKLQTLDLSGCNYLQVLPQGMGAMIDLSHLNVKGCDRLIHLPPYIGHLRNLRTLPIFIVDETRGNDLWELFSLHHLQGELKIKHLENVTSRSVSRRYGLTEGENSTLPCMQQLRSLALLWGDAVEGKQARCTLGTTGQTRERRTRIPAEAVIRVLRPNCHLKKLLINGYPGTLFPDWMSLVTLRSLTHLEFINCTSCESLPALGELPVLRVLHLKGMNSVPNIGDEFFGEGTICFPSLNELLVKDLPNLKTWEKTDSREAFGCLNRLTIINCPILITMPSFPSLRHLEVKNCNPVILRSVAKLQSLSTLAIVNFPDLFFLPKALLENKSRLLSLTVCSCPKLRSMPENFGNLRALKSLKIGWCQDLENIPHGLTNHTSLEVLEIIECPSLVSSSDESIDGLRSLRLLSLENCDGFTSLPIRLQDTTALERLTIMYCSNLISLPDDLQHLCALKSLTILGCAKLASLPKELQCITTLQNLEIHGCPELKELPEWLGNLMCLRSLAITGCHNIKSLPESLQCLSALQHLSIRDCPDLEKKFKEGKEADWQTISHTPYIYIG